MRNILLGASATSGDKSDTLAIKVCNWSSVGFFFIQFFYASFILYRLIFKNERSVSLIITTCMVIYSCVALSFLFAFADEDFYE